MVTINLTPRLRLAADHIEQHGWTQDCEREDDGRVCLTGAVRFCAPQNGDEYLIREVLRRRNRAEGWNDSDGRTADDVVDFLRTAEVTDTDLEDTFGPQWREIVTLIRQVATLTDEQAQKLAAAGAAAGAAAWYAARAAAGVVARDAARAPAGAPAWDGAGYAAWDAAGYAAWDAAWAISTRDLIGTSGYTQEHYDLLIGPWVSVMGYPEAATS